MRIIIDKAYLINTTADGGLEVDLEGVEAKEPPYELFRQMEEGLTQSGIDLDRAQMYVEAFARRVSVGELAHTLAQRVRAY